MFNGLDHRGGIVPDYPASSESATVVIVAGVMALTERERASLRSWLGRWTDYTGRIITPSEHETRLERLRLKR